MSLRPALVLWHRWFGLLAALWIVILALTGSVIVWADELDTWLNPDLRTVEISGSRLPVETLVQQLEAARPGMHVDYMQMPVEANKAVLAYLAPNGPLPPDFVFRQHYLDPYTGQLLGTRVFGEAGVDARHIVQFIYQLHTDLAMGPWMYWFFGLVALLWVFDHFFSLLISFPIAAKWRRSFLLRWREGGFRRTFDLHRATALWLFPITLMLAFTGWSMTWSSEFEKAIGLFSPIRPFPVSDLPTAPAPFYRTPIPVDNAIAIAEAQPGAGRVDAISWHPDKGVWWLRLFDARDLDDLGRRWVVVDYARGTVLRDRHQNAGSAGDRIKAWMFPLHTGKIMGLPGRIVIFLSGLVIAALTVTGVIIWMRKRSARIAARNRTIRRQPQWVAAE